MPNANFWGCFFLNFFFLSKGCDGILDTQTEIAHSRNDSFLPPLLGWNTNITHQSSSIFTWYTVAINNVIQAFKTQAINNHLKSNLNNNFKFPKSQPNMLTCCITNMWNWWVLISYSKIITIHESTRWSYETSKRHKL